MEDSAYLAQLLTGVFYTAAALPLLRLAARTGQHPERLLGWVFLLLGLSYLFYQTPFLPGMASLMTPLSFLGRVATGAAMAALAFFTRLVFRSQTRWGRTLAYGSAALIVLGICASVARGDWEGLTPLANPFFWLEWAGEIAPALWVSVEGFRQHRSATKRARFGLADPIVANRFFIWGVFGIAQAGTMLVLIPMNIEYELHGTFSTWADSAMSACETLSIAMVWLAFFPPAMYRRWVEQSVRAAPQEANPS